MHNSRAAQANHALLQIANCVLRVLRKVHNCLQGTFHKARLMSKVPNATTITASMDLGTRTF